jgi:transposase
MLPLFAAWKTSWRSTLSQQTPNARWFVWMKCLNNCSPTSETRFLLNQDNQNGSIMSTSARGVANLFMFFEPFLGQRQVKVTDTRTRLDWAEAMRELSDEKHPEAEKIIVVLDNLNTHTPAAFYLAFEPDEARRLVNRFEFHFTPKHGSWLNMAEIELSVLSRQCINRRIPDEETLKQEVQAWVKERNTKVVKVDWRFSTADARIKLKRPYPKIHD